jgi:hypothetical protein
MLRRALKVQESKMMIMPVATIVTFNIHNANQTIIIIIISP